MQALPFVLICGTIATSSSLFLGAYALRRRANSSSVLPFALLMLASAFYSAVYSAEISLCPVELAKLMLKIEYVGAMLVPLLWYLFAVSLASNASGSGLRELGPGRIAALAALPVASIILSWTNESHHLMYSSLTWRSEHSLLIPVTARGPWFWISTAYFDLLLAAGTMLIFFRALKSEGRFRAQSLLLVAAAFLPWLGHILLLLRSSPFGIDLSPFLLAVSGCFIALGIFGFGMFDLVPVARGLVMDTVGEGFIVLDRAGRIVDANRSARAAIPGLDAAVASPSSRALLAKLGVPSLGKAELSMGEGEALRWFRANAVEIEEEGRRRGTVVILSDVTEAKGLLSRLERLATTDELTKVDNRRRFFEHAERELAIARRRGSAISFAMLDLDHFKRVNDERGHAAGDAALIAACETCRSALRSTDILCRYGGEEFMIILPEAAPRAAREIVERVRSRIAALRIAPDGFSITASFGVSGYPGSSELARDGVSAGPDCLEDYLRQSDEALYRAKESGRNCVCLYEART
jgi:diguanylate cyclase (GGDEF) domain